MYAVGNALFFITRKNECYVYGQYNNKALAVPRKITISKQKPLLNNPGDPASLSVKCSIKLENIRQIIKGPEVLTDDYALFIIDKSGRVLVYGKNDEGQLGVGHSRRVDLLKKNKNLSQYYIVKIVATELTTLFLTNTGKVLICGYGFGSAVVVLPLPQWTNNIRDELVYLRESILNHTKNKVKWLWFKGGRLYHDNLLGPMKLAKNVYEIIRQIDTVLSKNLVFPIKEHALFYNILGSCQQYNTKINKRNLVNSIRCHPALPSFFSNFSKNAYGENEIISSWLPKEPSASSTAIVARK
jgi:hypothetical protein